MKFSVKTEYKYVYLVKNNTTVNNENTKYRGAVCGKYSYFDNIKDAAKWVDLRLIEQGKEPVNILVRK